MAIRKDIFKPGQSMALGVGTDFNAKFNLKPGDTVVIPAGKYEYIDIDKLDGITFINEGQVEIGNFYLKGNCKNVKLLGNGTPSIKYGIKFTNPARYAIQWYAVGDLEFSNIEINGSSLGFHLITEPSKPYPLNFVNILLHDCLISKTTLYEGIYIGHDLLGGPFINAKLWNNIIRNTGADGMQLRNGHFEVWDNMIDGTGVVAENGHAHGLLFGGNTKSGFARNNTLTNIGYYGIFCNGFGDFEYSGNKVQSKQCAILISNAYPNQDIQKVGYQKFTIRGNELVAASGKTMEIYYQNNGIKMTIDYQNNKTSGAVYKDVSSTTNFSLIDKNNNSSVVIGPVVPVPPNEIPTVNAGQDIEITLPNQLKLNGSGSDKEGAVSFLWTKISGGPATIVFPTASITDVTGLEQGAYVFELSVKDSAGATSKDQVNVKVNPMAIMVAHSFILDGISYTLFDNGTWK